ncbi:MAG: SDR family oxidoreductase [Myxococcales bacterium]
MKAKHRRTALVTGASRGIGLELARALAAQGHDLALVARDQEALTGVAQELARTGVATHVIRADLSETATPRALLEELSQRGLTVDLLVNNAGFGVFGPFADSDVDRTLDMLRVNIVTLTALTRLLLPGMIARGRGGILNVASSAAFQPGPLMASYYASKAYVLWFSEALAVELRGSGVNVCALCPGPTHSSFVDAAAIPASSLFDRNRFEDASEVARQGLRALERGQVVAVTRLRYRLLAFGNRFLPRSVVARLVERMQRPRLIASIGGP